uniref:UMA domain-containing protein n=1 Tax=Timema genevievae TaxID=629358 RepID=A0A7R9JVF5_TIMGE|nr:unnamed protein product [Timema genevievae]
MLNNTTQYCLLWCRRVRSDYPVAMSFSWFSGRKKSPDRDNSEEGENPNADLDSQDDTFVFIERKRNLPADNSELYPNLLPYPLAPTTATQPQSIERESNTTGTIQTQNFLSGVPFKLSSSALYNLQPSTFEADQASQLLERLRVAEFDYDFSVENSVLMEETEKSVLHIYADMVRVMIQNQVLCITRKVLSVQRHETKKDYVAHLFWSLLTGLHHDSENTRTLRHIKYPTDRPWLEIQLRARLEHVNIEMRRSICANDCVLVK